MNQETNKSGSPVEGYDRYDGILLVDKDRGESSYDVVRKVRRILPAIKVGHTGTLDPFAEGLLIILIGQGTKLSPYLMEGKKRYLATIKLGTETDTLDLTGKVINTFPISRLTTKKIEEGIQRFVGEIEQIPPAFSAVRHEGERAYKLARKGVKVELTKRRVKIYSIEKISIDLPEITMEITCSHGTYIRSFASDLGMELGSGAHLTCLRRLSSEPFKVADAIASTTLDHSISKMRLIEKLLSLRDAIPHLDMMPVDKETAERIRNGIKPKWEDIRERGFSDSYRGLIKIIDGSSLVAIMDVSPWCDDKNKWLKKIRVFN